MLGLMQDRALLISTIIEHAARHHGDAEVVSRTVEGPIHRYTYAEAGRRAKRVANMLGALGVGFGDRAATLAWNGYRHFELYYGISGIGAVMHTINPRLFPDQIAWIANHAEDKALFFDLTFLPLVEGIAARLPACRSFVLMTDRAHMPAASTIPGLLCYEDLLAAAAEEFAWPAFDENTASSLCYTSGTTGNPKGALYSHRSTMLHAYASALPDSLNCSARDVILPVVPMFHVNSWGLAYACPMVGAKLVLPGPHLDGRSVYELFEAERVTMSAGVPTVWQGLLAHMKQGGLRFSTLKSTVIGGSACPPAMIRTFQDEYGVKVLHAWGMTEMSPLGTVCNLKSKHLDQSAEEQFRVETTQGRAVFGVDMKIVGADGTDLPWDGKTFGDLYVRGPWVVRGYFKGEGGDPLVDGWFPTGDVATISADGYMQITDRSKDVIKSGGEWISSIDLENIAVAHPAVMQAAVIGVAHPKWDERPLLIVVRKPGAELTREELLRFFEGKIAKWWMPDDVAFVEAIPLGATGKMLKTRLREQFRDHRLPTA
ncbi:MAG: fatty-acid--CoA ligase [Burkholderiales bacterium]|nr:fatty-acid--CoA ligase [Burkholderiales bacterium]